MSNFNSEKNRVVWVDIPVTDLERASAFYRKVLAIKVDTMEFGGFKIAILDHQDGNGGCLIPSPDVPVSDHGILIYHNVDGRIRAAVAEVQGAGGSVLDDVHPIGPHGFRAIIRDSEGNRVALHSPTDA